MVWFGIRGNKAEDERWDFIQGKGCRKNFIGWKKGNKSQSKPESNQGAKKKYLSKIKCFNCHEFRHYATKCPHKKERNRTLGGGEGEAFASQFKIDFTLIACMVNTMMASMWYFDSCASIHMTKGREFFSDLEEKDLHMHIEMGDDGRYNTTKRGTITF